MTSPFGRDLTTFVGAEPDLDPSFRLIDGTRVVAEACARRLMTPRGTLPGDPDYGHDLRQHLQARMTPVKRAQIRSAVESEVTKDQRVISAKVEVTHDPNTRTTRIVVAAKTRVQRFDLTLTSNELGLKTDIVLGS